ncbi:Fe-S biogenesis protein NfuA [Saccharobesus litoralis]|uniref:Fe/S biogenesis protein NfuA n=1 Tax=Saccharobesus litoralis TaxID=2172099 RepID=A0A2S0VS46_9ALTE|nr:Fe-S biogenesis protein NfuA [Saccharobesus litoralis]AWB66992.1 Fe-S biogenesis protein NfuA [Saccharobesus litoralis]
MSENSPLISISEAAQGHFAKLLETQPEGTQIRVFVVNPGTPNAECGVSYCPADAIEDKDIRITFSAFDAIIDPDSEAYLEEAVIDFTTDQMGSQLTLKAPNAKMRKVAEDAPLQERVEYVLESTINPQLANHGGKVMLAELTEEGVAVLQFGGGCNGCSMVDLTLKEGIEKQLLEQFPGELTGVKDATDHEHGDHSYA